MLYLILLCAPQRKGGGTMDPMLRDFAIAVMAGIAANLISAWLMRH